MNSEICPFMLQHASIQQGEVWEGLNISPHSITILLFCLRVKWHEAQGARKDWAETVWCGCVDVAEGRVGPQTSERKEIRSVAGQPRKSPCALWLIRDVVCPRSEALLSCRCDRRAGLTEPHQSGENIYDGDASKGAPECPAVWIIHHLQSAVVPVGHEGLRRRQDRWQQSSSAKSLLFSPGGRWRVISFLFITKPGLSAFQLEMSQCWTCFWKKKKN